jgi:hypothetical protein
MALRPWIAVYVFTCGRCRMPYHNWFRHTCHVGLPMARAREQQEWTHRHQRGRRRRGR